MNERQKQLFLQRIDEVLFYVWDPINVKGVPVLDWWDYFVSPDRLGYKA